MRDGSLEIVEILLSFGANPAARDRRGNSALHMAVAAGAADMVAIMAARVSGGGGAGGGGGGMGRGGRGAAAMAAATGCGLNLSNDYGELLLLSLSVAVVAASITV